MKNLSQMEKIGLTAIGISLLFLVIEAFKIEALSSITPYGSYLFAIGVVLWIAGFFKRKEAEKKSDD
jgi:uncharacterized membrane protein